MHLTSCFKHLRSVFLLGGYFLVSPANAQESAADTAAVVSFADKFIIKANFSTQTDTYRYRGIQTGERLDLTTNTSLRLSFSLDYEFIGASLGFAPGFLANNNDQDLKGKSTFSDYRFRFFLGNWVQGLQYRNVKGYYVENTGDYIPEWQEGLDPFIQFPDLRNATYGMSTSYVVNPEFSLRNVLYQTEWQKVSAGSFIPAVFYDYNEFSFKEAALESKEWNINLRVSPSYYYTLVLHENWYLATNVTPALGLRFVGSRTEDEGSVTREKYTLFTKAMGTGLQLGYSSERMLFGLNLNLDINWYRQGEEASAENDQGYAVLYMGYRFNAPGLARKTMDRLYGR